MGIENDVLASLFPRSPRQRPSDEPGRRPTAKRIREDLEPCQGPLRSTRVHGWDGQGQKWLLFLSTMIEKTIAKARGGRWQGRWRQGREGYKDVWKKFKFHSYAYLNPFFSLFVHRVKNLKRRMACVKRQDMWHDQRVKVLNLALRELPGIESFGAYSPVGTRHLLRLRVIVSQDRRMCLDLQRAVQPRGRGTRWSHDDKSIALVYRISLRFDILNMWYATLQAWQTCCCHDLGCRVTKAGN